MCCALKLRSIFPSEDGIYTTFRPSPDMLAFICGDDSWSRIFLDIEAGKRDKNC